jgi:hypothetical protein
MNPAFLRLSCLAMLTAAASSITCLATDPNHCAHRTGTRGHTYCLEQHPDFPLCSRCEASNDRNGCTADADDTECLVGAPEPEESSGSSDDSTTDAETTGPPVCDPADCAARDAMRPLCGDEGECVPCGEAGGDEACAAANPDLPACLTEDEGAESAGACVGCSETSPAACSGQALICNVDTHECTRCDSHSQCLAALGSACDIERHECLPQDKVWHVDGSSTVTANGTAENPYTTIAAALAEIGPGESGTIILHDADEPYTEPLAIGGGRVVAIIAPPEERPTILLDGTGDQVFIVDSGTVVYLEGVTVQANSDVAGLRIEVATIYLDRCEVTGSRTGIEVVADGELVLRNSIVATIADDVALSVDAASANVLYSTVVHTGIDILDVDPDAIRCTSPREVTVRNSIVLSRDTGTYVWDCPGASVSYTAGEGIPLGSGNKRLCDNQLNCTMDVIPGLFIDLTSLRLHPDSADVFMGILPSRRELGDPVIDIDGNSRTLGHDFAGAHAPDPRSP